MLRYCRLTVKQRELQELMENWYYVFCSDTATPELKDFVRKRMLSKMSEYDKLFRVNHKYKGINY